VVKKGQTITGVVYGVRLDLELDLFNVDQCTRPAEVSKGDSQFRKVRPDEAWNRTKYERDSKLQVRKKRAEVDKARRVIKHPNFHTFNSPQAELYLETQQRGDVVVRPSSKGVEHLAVTWKVHDGLYQHLQMLPSLTLTPRARQSVASWWWIAYTFILIWII
jgi:transcription elongation factor SPT6